MTATSAPAPTAARRLPVKHEYLMCPPKRFTVEYSINPWMDPTVPVDTGLAMAQWSNLVETFRELGHTVHEIEPEPGLPDMVFAANSGVVLDGRVLGAKFRSDERAAEAEHYRRWFTAAGYHEVAMPTHINEGEGDFAWTGSLLLAASGFRTARAAHAEAQEFFGVPVVSLRLIDPRFYHLDTALCVLDEATESGAAQVAYFPGAFSDGSRNVLERLFPRAIRVGEADARHLGLNAVSDGRNVIVPRQAGGFAAALTERGYETIPVDTAELLKSGGGPKCCTLELRNGLRG